MAFCYWWFLTSRISAKKPPSLNLQQSNESWHRRSTNLVTSRKRQWAKQWMPSPVSLERRTLFLDLKNSKNPDLWKKVAVFWEPIYTPCVYTGSISPPFEGPMILIGNFKIHWHSIDPPLGSIRCKQRPPWRKNRVATSQLADDSMWPKRL